MKESEREEWVSFIAWIKSRSVRGVIGGRSRSVYNVRIFGEKQPSLVSTLAISHRALRRTPSVGITLPPVGRIKNYARITAHERIFVISANESTAHILELPQFARVRKLGEAKSGRGELLTRHFYFNIFSASLFFRKHFFCLRFRQK